MIEISIIVPVYNKEKYLKRCIDSLINQSFTEIEIILIDDGSTDISLGICKYYEKLDNRISVIEKENGGASSARNVGIRAARGQYILFVDADDYIEETACEDLWNGVLAGENIDIILGDRICYFNDGESRQLFHNSKKGGQILSGQEYMQEEIKAGSMYFVVVSALYRRKFILKNQLYFKEGIYDEDEDWVPRAFILARNVWDTGVLVYHHCVTPGSVMQTNKEKHDRDCVGLCYDLYNFIKKYANKDLKIALENRMFYLYTESVFTSKLYRERGLVKRIFVIKLSHGWKNHFKAFCIFLNKNLYFVLLKFLRGLK